MSASDEFSVTGSESHRLTTRVVLRPLGSPLPLGLLGLFIGTLVLSGLQLHWVGIDQSHELARAVLLVTVPLQLLSSIFGFLARDLVAGTGMGLLAGTWAVLATSMLLAPAGTTSAGLGLLLIVAGAALLVPAAGAAEGKVAAALVLFVAAVRFAFTGVYELTGDAGWETTAGVTGLVLAGLAFYAALGFELEDQQRRTVLPLLRVGAGRDAMHAALSAQVAHVEHEAGVRKQL